MSESSHFVFDRDTAVMPAGEHQYSSEITPRWNIGSIPNGGYLMAMAARALSRELPHPHPLTITGHYLERAENGPASWLCEPIRQGKSISTGAARLVQEDVERARFMAAFTDFSVMEGETHIEEPVPVMPPPESCAYEIKMPVAINDQVDIRFTPEHQQWMQGQLGNISELKGWVRLTDGREPDVFALVLFADVFPPALFNRTGPRGWVPTIELTVHVRQQPQPGFVACRFRTRYLTQGILEADGELWDSAGNLVAISRQIAKLRLPHKKPEKSLSPAR